MPGNGAVDEVAAAAPAMHLALWLEVALAAFALVALSRKAKGVLVVLGAVNVKVQGGVVQLTQGDLAGLGSEEFL